MNYSVEDIVGDVRIALDLNSEANEIVTNDSNTLSVDEIILQKIEHGVRMVLEHSPLDKVDSGVILPVSDITWEVSRGIGKGSILLPDDYLRLLVFKMSDWRVPVQDTISVDNALYLAQQSRYVRGTPSRPVVAIVHNNQGKVLEFYTCNGGDSVTISSGLYIPEPSVVANTISIPSKLYMSSIYQIAGLVAMTLKDSHSKNLFEIAEVNLNEKVS